MNYMKLYDDLILSRKNRILGDEKYHIHHILPKSLGGDDSQDNLIKLTLKEHYIAHCLLWKHFKQNGDKIGQVKMSRALCIMTYGNPLCMNKININSKLFVKIQNDRIKNISKYITYKGKTKTLKEWSKLLNIDYQLIRSRLYEGWSVDRIFEKEKEMSHRILDYKVEFNGKLKSILEFSNESGIDPNIIYQRIKREKISNKTTKNLLDPIRSVKKAYTVGQEALNLKSWANKLNIDYDLLRVFIYIKKRYHQKKQFRVK